MQDEILNNLYWIQEMLPPAAEAIPKHKGLAFYMDMRLILILVEQSNSTYEHKGVSYPFQLWNGLILPVEYKKQSAFFMKYSFLENHPFSKDWLYIPAESENFEEEARLIIREISRGNPLLGLPVKHKELKSEKAPSKPQKKSAEMPKADKKKENSFLLNMVNRGKK